MSSTLIRFIFFKERQQILLLIPIPQFCTKGLRNTITNKRPRENRSYEEVHRIQQEDLSPNRVIKPACVGRMSEHRIDATGDQLMSGNLFFPNDMRKVRSKLDFSSKTKEKTRRRYHKSKPEYKRLVLLTTGNNNSHTYNPNQLCSIQNSIIPKRVQVTYCQF